MTGYQRIMNAIRGQQVDQTPVWPFVMMFAANYTSTPYGKFSSDYREMAASLIRTAQDFQLDAVTVDSDAYREASACGAVLDFPEDGLPIVRKNAIEDRSAFRFPYIRIEEAERLMDKIEGVSAVKRYFGEEKAVCGWVEAPLQCAGTLYGMEDYLSDIFEEPEFIKDLLEYVTEMNIRFARLQVEAGADIIGIGDAMATLVSPSIYEEYFLPYTRRLVQEIKKDHDVMLKYHICGNSGHLLRFAEEIGFDIVNIDYLVDYPSAVEAVHGNICLKGNMNPVTLLRQSPEVITEEARKLLDVGYERFILSPGCEVGRDTPWENMHAFVNSVKQRS